MPTIVDFLSALMAGTKHDVEGFRKVATPAGREQEALERQTAIAQQKLFQDVLQKAAADPQFNSALQQAQTPFLQNESLRAGTAGQVQQNQQGASFGPRGYQGAALDQGEKHFQVQQETQRRGQNIASQEAFMNRERQTNEGEADRRSRMELELVQQGGAADRQRSQQSSQMNSEKLRAATAMYEKMFPGIPPSAAQSGFAADVGYPVQEDPQQALAKQNAQRVMEMIGRKRSPQQQLDASRTQATPESRGFASEMLSSAATQQRQPQQQGSQIDQRAQQAQPNATEQMLQTIQKQYNLPTSPDLPTILRLLQQLQEATR